MAIPGAPARIATSGVYTVLDTDFGLIVKFDGVHHLEITVPGDYFDKVRWYYTSQHHILIKHIHEFLSLKNDYVGYFANVNWSLIKIIPSCKKNPSLYFLIHFQPCVQVCGMCGNYNGDAADDNLMPGGKPAKDVIELGNSWKSEGDSDPG